MTTFTALKNPNMTVWGDLNLQRSLDLTQIGEGLKVFGDLKIQGCHRLKQLPKNLQVAGGLLIKSCQSVEVLPESIELTGDLVVIGCPNLRSLPKRIKAKRLVLIGCSQVRELPLDVECESLRLKDCSIASIPETWSQPSQLQLENCPNLRRLPSSWESLGEIHLERFEVHNCPIAHLPRTVKAHKKISLSFLNRITLSCDLSANFIKILNSPALLEIEGSLSATRLSIVNCPQLRRFSAPSRALEVFKLIQCESLESLPKGMGMESSWSSKIKVVDCAQLKEFPKRMYFRGDLVMKNTSITQLPTPMRACRVLWRGYYVPSDTIFCPQALSSGQILTERNAELRRLMLEKVGVAWALKKAHAKTVHSDVDRSGKPRFLVETKFTYPESHKVNYRFLRCRCPSTDREFLLAVPASVTTCHEAAAWLAGFDNPDEYQPIMET